jgi:hypothetical protein
MIGSKRLTLLDFYSIVIAESDDNATVLEVDLGLKFWTTVLRL